MKKRRNVYYFDYSPEAYSYIMTSKILRQSEKNILLALKMVLFMILLTAGIEKLSMCGL